MNKMLIFAALSLVMLGAAAEKADSLQKTTVQFETLDVDDVTQAKVVSGKVVITRGSLLMKAEKATVTEDPQGYQFVTLLALPGEAVTFRQKRDGGPDLWVEGQADRIEYNEKTEIVKLFTKAKIRQLEGAKLTDELDSEFITYDSRKDTMMARNDASGQNKPGKGRGTMVIESKNTGARPAASSATSVAKPPDTAASAAESSAPAPGKK